MAGRRDTRVVESHAIARFALRLAGVFGLAALAWSIEVLVRSGSWWGPMHAFLAGTVLLAISGVSQMFTITWATAPAPSRRLTTFQRWSVAGGVVLVLFGVTGHVAALTWIGAVAVGAGLAALTVSIIGTIRRSLLRRFDLSARFYVTAFVAGAVGVTLGAILGTGSAGTEVLTVRLVHSHLNLLGLVGLTIIGTLPTFLPTTAHHRAVSGREAIVAWWLGAVGVVMIAAGLTGETVLVATGNLAIATAAVLITAGVLIRIGRKGARRLPFVQVTLGIGWLTLWAVVDGIGILRTGSSPLFGVWVVIAVVAGVGQVLAGSLTYLIPVLLGPPLEAAATQLTRRAWLPLTLVNFAGVSLVAGWEMAAVAAVALWVVDGAARVGALIRVRHNR